MLEDGGELDRYMQTEGETLWIAATVRIEGLHLNIENVVIYPTTSAQAMVGVREMLAVRALLEEEMRQQGLRSYTLRAVRGSAGGRARTISLNRRLQ